MTMAVQQTHNIEIVTRRTSAKVDAQWARRWCPDACQDLCCADRRVVQRLWQHHILRAHLWIWQVVTRTTLSWVPSVAKSGHRVVCRNELLQTSITCCAPNLDAVARGDMWAFASTWPQDKLSQPLLRVRVAASCISTSAHLSLPQPTAAGSRLRPHSPQLSTSICPAESQFQTPTPPSLQPSPCTHLCAQLAFHVCIFVILGDHQQLWADAQEVVLEV